VYLEESSMKIKKYQWRKIIRGKRTKSITLNELQRCCFMPRVTFVKIIMMMLSKNTPKTNTIMGKKWEKVPLPYFSCITIELISSLSVKADHAKVNSNNQREWPKHKKVTMYWKHKKVWVSKLFMPKSIQIINVSDQNIRKWQCTEVVKLLQLGKTTEVVRS
jgi:hypothetical protein